MGDDKKSEDLEPEDSSVATQKLDNDEIRKLLTDRGVDPENIDVPSDEPDHVSDEDDAS